MSKDQVVLVVASGKSICVNLNGQTPHILKEGSIIRPDDEQQMKRLGMVPKDIEKMLANGRLVKTILEADGGVRVPSRDTTRLGAVVPGSDSGGGVDETSSNEGAEAPVLPPPGGPRLGAPEGQAPGVWGYEPQSLQGMDLMALNQLVLNIQPDMQPFATREEAIAQLSVDFRAQAAASTQVASS